MEQGKNIGGSIKTTQIDSFEKNGAIYHRMICPYCRKILVFRKDSNFYPKGSTMKCTKCRGLFKKFVRPGKRDLSNPKP